MSLLRRRMLLAASQMVGGDGLEFPITLVEGGNGQVGVDLYNYIMEKGREIADELGFFMYYPSEAEKVYVFDSTVDYFVYEGNNMLKFNLKPYIASILALWLNPDGSLSINWD
jgi:hypothetical protein